MTLGACAPAQTVQTQTAQTQAPPTAVGEHAAVFMPGGQQLAQICAGHGRVAAGGNLVWDSGQTQLGQTLGGQPRLSRPAPYLLSCYDYTVKNDGTTLSVQDDTLAKALTHFDPDAGFLRYFAGFSVTFPKAGLVSADPATDVPEGQRAALAGVAVTVSQAGQPDAAVVENGAVTAQRYDPARPLTIRLKTGATQWPEVTVQAAKGLITAPVRGF